MKIKDSLLSKKMLTSSIDKSMSRYEKSVPGKEEVDIVKGKAFVVGRCNSCRRCETSMLSELNVKVQNKINIFNIHGQRNIDTDGIIIWRKEKKELTQNFDMKNHGIRNQI